MNWHAQFEAWQEVSFGFLMLILGLLLEWAIDVWRERRWDTDHPDANHPHIS